MNAPIWKLIKLLLGNILTLSLEENFNSSLKRKENTYTITWEPMNKTSLD